MKAAVANELSLCTAARGDDAIARHCPACTEQRPHTAAEWKNHPLAGHGYSKLTTWTHPHLKHVRLAGRA